MPEPIELKRKVITGSQDGPHFLITGGVHGDEFESMAVIRRLMREVDPQKLRGRLTLVPIVNEAAFWSGLRWADEDQLDLARTCPGRPHGSVTERTAHALSELIRSADYYIDLHSGGIVMRVAPMVGYGLHKRQPEVLETQRRMAKAFNLPIIWGTSGELDGRSLSIARDANVPAIYTEWQGGGECDRQGVEDEFEGCLNVMAEVGMIDRPPPIPCAMYVVEDDRPNSGYMQINYQSPMDGYFEPQVELMQRVRAGEALGVVSDALGDRNETIVSTQTGFVLTLRCFNRVFKEDSLAVIVELP